MSIHSTFVNLYINTHIYIYICYYFDWELCWHNYCTMLNKIIMTSECLVFLIINISWISHYLIHWSSIHTQLLMHIYMHYLCMHYMQALEINLYGVRTGRFVIVRLLRGFLLSVHWTPNWGRLIYCRDVRGVSGRGFKGALIGPPWCREVERL